MDGKNPPNLDTMRVCGGFKYTASPTFSAINKTGVDVAIAEPAEDIEGETTEVIDNKGNVINEEEASFVFKTALTADPVGVWAAAGIEYDCDVATLLADINDAAFSTPNELKLYNALIAVGIKNLMVENSTLYPSEVPELAEPLKPTTPSEVQVLNALNAT